MLLLCCVKPQHRQRHYIEGALVGRGKAHLRSGTFVVRLREPPGAQTPGVARLQPGKAMFGPWRGQIVAKVFGKRQKLGRHHGANRVLAAIRWAEAVWKLSCEGHLVVRWI